MNVFLFQLNSLMLTMPILLPVVTLLCQHRSNGDNRTTFKEFNKENKLKRYQSNNNQEKVKIP